MKLLNYLVNRLKGLFSKPNVYKEGDEKSKSKVKIGEKIGNITILHQYQLDKHTDFKPGESYKVGEAIVTVHANKASMLAALAKYEANRLLKEKQLKERGIELMLMSPEELGALQLDEWLEKKEKLGHKVQRTINLPLKPPPLGTKEAAIKEQFEEVMKDVKIADKV